MNQSAQDTKINTKKNSLRLSIIIGMWVTFPSFGRMCVFLLFSDI